MHGFAAGLRIEDPVEVDLAEVLLLGLQVACLHDPDGELGVQPAQVVPIGPAAVVQAGWVWQVGVVKRKSNKSINLSCVLEGLISYFVSHFSSSSWEPQEA